jgi:hypothetical protein
MVKRKNGYGEIFTKKQTEYIHSQIQNLRTIGHQQNIIRNSHKTLKKILICKKMTSFENMAR